MKNLPIFSLIKEETENFFNSNIFETLDPNVIFSYIPQGYEHNILDETFNSVNEIKKLSDDILKNVAEINYREFIKYNKLGLIYGSNLSKIKNNYDEIKNFVSDSNLQIRFDPTPNNSVAAYGHLVVNKGEDFNPKQRRNIDLYYDYFKYKNLILSLVYNNPNKKQINVNYIYSVLFHLFNDALIHELQHAYDDYKSGGMSYNTKTYDTYKEKYYDKVDGVYHQKKIQDLNQYKNYLNLPHEIWARFSQAMNKTKFFISDTDNNVTDNNPNTIYPINDVIKSFGDNFLGYDSLSDEMKKTLIRKVAQFWHYEEENIKKQNNQKVNYPLK